VSVRATVIGAGSWGTTFAAVLADAGCQVTIWGRDERVCRQIAAEHRNDPYLPGVRLPDAVGAQADLVASVEGADLVAVAVPAQSARRTLAPLAGRLGPATIVVSLMKGVELATDLRMSQVLGEVLGVPDDRLAVVSGPNLAHEIAARQPTATVVAASDRTTADRVAAACASAYFRPYTNGDVVGVELCGAVKNVIALAVGISQGRGLGFNTMATLITRGLAEISRLGRALGADEQTFGGLAGMGDLMATCASPDSRNHRLGTLLGQGLGLAAAIEATGGTAEGVKTSRPVLDLARALGVDMPITEGVVEVLDGSLSIDDLAPRLLARPRKAEGQPS
jgi:glycerol-3-phosphate dehydrogenase (NAD(P)+)